MSLAGDLLANHGSRRGLSEILVMPFLLVLVRLFTILLIADYYNVMAESSFKTCLPRLVLQENRFFDGARAYTTPDAHTSYWAENE